MNHATVVNARYGGLVLNWLFVLLTMMSFMVADPAMARRINGGLAGGTLIPPFEPPVAGIPPQFDITGYLEAATVDPTMCPGVTNPRLKGGTARLNGQTITIPCNTILQMPAFALTWADLWTMAPKDTMPTGSTASGLALGDIMTTGALGLLNTPWTDANTGLATSYNAPLPSHEFHIQGNTINGKNIAGLIFISQQSLNAGQGIISCIDYATGEMQVGGTVLPHGTTPCPTPVQLAASGQKVTRIRLNDPVGRFGIVHGGPGTVGADVIEPGYDPRYTADTDNPTISSALGYPVCVPAFNPVNPVTDPVTGAVIPAAIDAQCPMYNRPISPNCPSYNPLTLLPAFGGQAAGYCTTWLMDAPGAHAANPAKSDPTVAAPLVIGDMIVFHGTMKADATGPYISVHTIEANLGIYTQPHTAPSYVRIESMGVGTGGGTIGGVAVESTLKVFWTGFSTDPTELVDFYSIHNDPITGAETDYFQGTFDPCCVPLGRFRSPVNNVGVFGEPQRNYRAVSRTMCQPAGVNGPLTPQLQSRCYMAPPATPDASAVQATIALNQNGLVEGQFTLPNFGFIFGENLAFGGPVIPANFQDIPFLFCGSGPIGGPGTPTTVVGQLDPAPWGLPMADPIFHSTLCPAALAVGAAAVVAGPPAPLPPVINSVTATPPSALAGVLTTVTLTVSATNPQGTPMSFAWTPPAGVVMSCGVCAPNANNATVTATFNAKTAGALAFGVTVSNGVLPNATGSVSVTVAATGSKAPTLKSFAATPANLNGGAIGTLTATGTSNPAGASVTFSFKQTGGPAVLVGGVIVPLGQPIPVKTTSGVAPATQTASATFSAPFVPAAGKMTFQACATDTVSGLVTCSSATAQSVNVAATPADVLTVTVATYRPIVSRVGAPAQLGKFNMNVTSSASPSTPPPAGMTMTASIVNSTLPANVSGSTALPIVMPLLFTPADVPGTLTPVCGATPCWVGLADGIIQDPTQTPTALLTPTLVTVRSSLGGVVTTFPGDGIFVIR